jgi:hypothetical protein
LLESVYEVVLVLEPKTWIISQPPGIHTDRISRIIHRDIPQIFVSWSLLREKEKIIFYDSFRPGITAAESDAVFIPGVFLTFQA